jgi:Tol biopolymer transport system component
VNNDGPGLLWVPDGRIIFASYDGPSNDSENLWEIMSDPQTGKPSGIAAKITNWDGQYTYASSVTRDGNRLAVVKNHHRDDVYVGELQGAGTRLAPATRLTVSESKDNPTGWMRDNKTILFSSDRTGRLQVFRQKILQDTAERLIMGLDDQVGAELSPDGRWILYWSTEPSRDKPPATRRLMRLPALGGSPEPVLEARMDDPADFDCPVRPASSCVFSHWEQGQLIFYALDPVHGRGKEFARTKLGSPADSTSSVSPEGSRIAVASMGQLPEQIRIVDLRNGTERNLHLPPGWRIWQVSWATDGNALFAAAGAAGSFIARIELDGKTRVLLNLARSQWLSSPCPSPDGRHLAFRQRTFESNAWLLENF